MSDGAPSTVWRIEKAPPGPSQRSQPLIAPLSKSDAQRVLVLTHFLGCPERADFATAAHALPADVEATRRGLEQLRSAGSSVLDIQCEDGGTPFRLLLGQAAVTQGARVRLWGTPRLGERPHRPLIESLRAALGESGLKITEGTPWPVEVSGFTQTVQTPVFRVNASASSQFATSILLAAAALAFKENRTWTVELLGSSASLGYLDLTLHWLKYAGFQVEEAANRLMISRGGQLPSRFAVPSDWSSLGYLVLIAWKTGLPLFDPAIAANHPDKAVLRILAAAGLEVGSNPLLSGRLTKGVLASGLECPDLLPTLAAIACIAPAQSRFTEVDILRDKESDRLQGMMDMVAAFGAGADYKQNVLVITPSKHRPPQFRVDSRGDHRMAMSAAVLSILSEVPLELVNPLCVSKSFPDFWKQLSAAGVLMTQNISQSQVP